MLHVTPITALLLPGCQAAVYNYTLERNAAAVVWFCVNMQRRHKEGTLKRLYSAISVQKGLMMASIKHKELKTDVVGAMRRL